MAEDVKERGRQPKMTEHLPSFQAGYFLRPDGVAFRGRLGGQPDIILASLERSIDSDALAVRVPSPAPNVVQSTLCGGPVPLERLQ